MGTLPNDLDAFLGDIRYVLTGLADLATEERAKHSGWAPMASSPAHLEQVEGARYRADWGDPVSFAFGMALAHLTMAEEGMRAQARLLEVPTALAHLAPARMCVEASARAWVLLDPEATTAQRAGRWATAQMHELWEIRKLGEPFKTELRIDPQIEAITASATAVGLTVTRPAKDAPWVEEPRLGLIALVQRQFRAENMLEVGVDLVRSFSGVVHGHSDAVGRSSERRPDGGTTLVLRPENVVLPAMGMCIGYGAAVERLFLYLGWPTADLQDRIAELGATVVHWEKVTR